MNCDCQYSQNNSKIASLTYLMDQNSSVNSRHFCHTTDVKNNRSSGLNILEKIALRKIFVNGTSESQKYGIKQLWPHCVEAEQKTQCREFIGVHQEALPSLICLDHFYTSNNFVPHYRGLKEKPSKSFF